MDISYEASKDLVPFREPADTSQLVLRATENLQNLSKWNGLLILFCLFSKDWQKHSLSIVCPFLQVLKCSSAVSC